jgi:hypothetical protein
MLALLAGCNFFASEPNWQDQLEPSGPCYAFDLGDGVATDDNAELHAIFACLNRGGLLHAFEATDRTLDAPTRQGTVGGELVELAGAVGAASDVSVAGLFESALDTLDDREGTGELVELVLELAYAASVAELGGGVTINSSPSLHEGLLVPAAETVAAVGRVLLDDDLAAAPIVGGALRSEAAPRWLWTLALAPEAPDAGLSQLAEYWPLTVAQIIEQAADTSNNRHAGATGDSLRDGAVALLGGDALPSLVAAASPILDDEYAVDALARWVEEADAAGDWQDLDDGLLYLARVDRQGGSLSDGEVTALEGLVRLLHDANRPVDCSIDIFVTDIEFSLGNLAVAILQVLGGTDGGTAAGSVDVLGDALGYPLTGAILDTIADTGVCPVIDQEFVDDLDALDRLSDPPAEPLLAVLLGLLRAEDDHIDTVADVVTALHDESLVWPLEELLYDVATRSAADRLLAAAPALLDPDGRQESAAFPAGVRPVDVHAVVAFVVGVTEADSWAAVGPALSVAVAEASTWEAVDNAHRLLTRSGTVTERLLPMLAERLATAPELAWLDTAADLVEDPAVTGGALRLLEVDDLRVALLDTELLAPGPMPWLAELQTGGTLEQLWDTLALFRPLLGEPDV